MTWACSRISTGEQLVNRQPCSAKSLNLIGFTDPWFFISCYFLINVPTHQFRPPCDIDLDSVAMDAALGGCKINRQTNWSVTDRPMDRQRDRQTDGQTLEKNDAYVSACLCKWHQNAFFNIIKDFLLGLYYRIFPF